MTTGNGLLARLAALFHQQADAPDAPDMQANDTLEPELEGDMVFHVSYRDSAGDISERLVLVQRIYDRGGNLYISGECQLRQAYRAFRVDRIETLANGRTGEVIRWPAPFLRGIAGLAERRSLDPHGPESIAARSPNRKALDELRSRTRPTAILMMALAHSDADFVEAERAAISAMIEAEPGPATPLQRAELANEFMALVPSGNHVTRAARLILGQSERASTVPAWCRRMIEADGVAHPEEVAMFRQIVETVAKRQVEG
jgi:WYL domain